MSQEKSSTGLLVTTTVAITDGEVVITFAPECGDLREALVDLLYCARGQGKYSRLMNERGEVLDVSVAADKRSLRDNIGGVLLNAAKVTVRIRDGFAEDMRDRLNRAIIKRPSGRIVMK
jgi:hypothetical protein